MLPWIHLFIALASNVICVYFLKKAEGFSILWPSLGALLFIGLAQWFLSRAMHAGLGAGLSVAVICVGVMVAGALMGAVFFGENLSAQKVAGFALAIAGIVVASLAKA